MVVYYDEPAGLEGGIDDAWDTVREGILDGAHARPAPAIVASTLPELLQPETTPG